MFYGNTIQDIRSLFFLSWKKFKKEEALTPLEKQLVGVINDHPEYQQMLEQPIEDVALQAGQENPFLHMGLHLAVRDQIQLNRPEGIVEVYQTLYQKHGDPLYIEHLMMEPLALCLWEAQRDQRALDEASYLQVCKGLLSDG